MNVYKVEVEFKGKSYIEIEAENVEDAKMKASCEYMDDGNITDIEITNFDFED